MQDLEETLKEKNKINKTIDIETVLGFIKYYNMPLEKQQHEQTAIEITNILMDALDNPKGGKFSGEDEFNKYWDNNYTTNKETLK